MAFALAFCSGVKAQTYTAIGVTGYNADVIAEGTGAVSASTTNDVDGVNYTFMAQGYTNPSNTTTTRGLPSTGLITSAVTATPGLTFQLASFAANNSLRINGTGTDTLTFPTPAAAEKIYVLATSGSGTSNTTITVMFSDGTTQVFPAITVNDWYGGSNYAINGIGRANRTDNGIDNNSNDPRLYQYELTLLPSNVTRSVQRISFSNTGSVLNVMGITILPSAAPATTDAGIAAITTPTSPVMQNISQPVQVTLINQGTSPLTSASITWKVDGATQPAFAWTGNLAFNQSTTVTLGNFTFSPGNHTVMARATNPNNGTDGFAANDSVQISVNACNILAGIYTIDQNSPASATNFQTIGAAVTALNSCGISGPVTFNIAAGSGPYNEQVEILPVIGASAVNTITFNGNGDTIQANPASAARHIIKLNGADHVTINNFSILATGTTSSSYGYGIHLINGADYNTITNNTISIGSTSTSSLNSGGIIFSNSNTSTTTTGNNGNHNVISGNTINGGYKGIGVYGLAASPGNNHILNNTIRNFYASGIDLGTSNNTLVEGNNISRPNRSSVGTFEGINLNGGTRNSMISKNRIHTSHGTATSGSAYGIYSTSNDAPAGAENIVTNNLIYNLGANASTIYGIYNIGSNGIYYYHNTVNLDNTSHTGTIRGFYQTTTANNIRFNNNIININSGATGVKHAIYLGSVTSATIATDIQSDNNVFNQTGGTTASGIGSWGSANKATLSDWISSSNKDSASQAADPLFTSVATGNFLPTATSINNIGKALMPAVTDDITGAIRNPLTPDPGAYEMGAFNPPANDAGISAITNPNSGCSLTNAETITVTVNNFGTTPLSNIPVSYTINGGTAVNETVAGPIAPGSTLSYSFTTTANLSAPGSYTILAGTNLSGDGTASNDSFTKIVVVSGLPAVPGITAGGPLTFCTGGSVVLTAASATAGATYSWFKDGVAITGATAAAYTANTAGSYTAVASANGCSSAASAASTVIVNTLPAIPTITTGSATTFCDGDSVTLTAATTTTGATYQWFSNGNAISGATASTYTAHTSGNYTVTAAAGGCDATSAATMLTVNPLPATPVITRTGFTLTSSSSTGNQWLKDGNVITGATNATYNVTSNGSYTVKVTSSGCTSAISNTVAIVNTGIRDPENRLQLSLYPNPSSGIFNLTFAEVEAYEVLVTDLSGKVILRNSGKARSAQLDLKAAAKGVYLLQITNEGKTATRKLVVE